MSKAQDRLNEVTKSKVFKKRLEDNVVNAFNNKPKKSIAKIFQKTLDEAEIELKERRKIR